MELIKVVIIGAGGFGREVLDVFDAINNAKPTFDVIGFIVDDSYGKPGDVINNKSILGGFDWLAKHKEDVYAVCGVGTPELRLKLIRKAESIGAQFCSAVHPKATLTNWISIGNGTIIAAGCILTNQIKIGKHVHLNLDCTIGHDVVIEDFVTVSPGCHISGRVQIRRGAFIGTGTNIIENLKIGYWSVVGAGSTVIKDIRKNSVAVGNPAKEIKLKIEGWQQDV
jgi:sugar O-acyltransferase (sialic acid O-acetyltransferase NeuD family)